MRRALEERVGILEDIASNPAANPGDRIRALEVLARYGLGTQDEREQSGEVTVRVSYEPPAGADRDG